MSKKNRRKTLVKKESFVTKGDFSADSSKVYIIATIIMFHVLPLAFVFSEIGKMMHAEAFYLSANVLFISITGVIYGIKQGFDFKFPLVMSVLAILSIIFYGDFAPEMTIVGPFVLGVVYLIWAYATVFLGGFLKRLFRL